MEVEEKINEHGWKKLDESGWKMDECVLRNG